ncbi:MAG: FmdB family zinc ribbon protein [Candidatus Dormibacteria bacterium]
MPTYGYRCENNGHEFEIVQGISEPALTACSTCGGPVSRIFYPVGIVFKGQGFYKTDSRKASSSATPGGEAKKAAAPDSGTSAPGGDSAPSSESKPPAEPRPSAGSKPATDTGPAAESKPAPDTRPASGSKSSK